MVSAPFATNNTVTKGTKLPGNRTVIRKLSFALDALSLSIAAQFLRCLRTLFFGYSGAIFERLKISFHRPRWRKTRLSCTTGFGRCDYLDFLPKRPQGAAKILGTLALAGTKTPAALKFSSKGATTDCVETPVNCPHCGQKWRLRRRLRRQPFILLSFSSSEKLRKAQEAQSYQRFHASVIRTSRVSQTPPQTPPPYFYQWVLHGKKWSWRNRLQMAHVCFRG